MGYNLARPHWGRGLATEATAAVIAYGFERANLEKILSTADARNEASIRVMQKLGMAWEDTRHNQQAHRGEQVDEVRYAIRKEDWLAASSR
jgi:ribosomal-protein-alanine N-acetyltransferase